LKKDFLLSLTTHFVTLSRNVVIISQKELEEHQPGFKTPKDTTHTNMSICLLPPKCGFEITYDG
jgi:hypothetical protein